MVLTYRKRVTCLSGLYDQYPWTGANADIDMAAAIGADCVDFSALPQTIAAMKTGTDHIANAAAYAHSKGLRIAIRIAEYKYANNNTGLLSQWDAFTKQPDAQARFLADFEWLLQHDIDGIEIEESEGTTATISAVNTAAWQQFKNQFLAKEKAIVQKYKNLDNFMWGLNWANDWLPTKYKLGYDLDTIIQQDLVNYIAPQMLQPLVSQWDSRYVEVVSKFAGSGIGLVFYSYVYSHAYSSICSGTTTRVPECYNQSLFHELTRIFQDGHGSAIFVLTRLRASRSMWPNDQTPTESSGICYAGETCAGDSVKYIWQSATPPPPPPPEPQPQPDQGGSALKLFAIVGGTLLLKEILDK